MATSNPRNALDLKLNVLGPPGAHKRLATSTRVRTCWYCPPDRTARGSAPCRKKGTYSRLEKHWEIDDYGLPVAGIGAQVIRNLVRALCLVHRDLEKAGVYCHDRCFGCGSASCRKKGTYSRLEKHWEIDDCGLPVAQIGAQVIRNLVRAPHMVLN